MAVLGYKRDFQDDLDPEELIKDIPDPKLTDRKHNNQEKESYSNHKKSNQRIKSRNLY